MAGQSAPVVVIDVVAAVAGFIPLLLHYQLSFSAMLAVTVV